MVAGVESNMVLMEMTGHTTTQVHIVAALPRKFAT
jgi:hypothetical protein